MRAEPHSKPKPKRVIAIGGSAVPFPRFPVMSGPRSFSISSSPHLSTAERKGPSRLKPNAGVVQHQAKGKGVILLAIENGGEEEKPA